MRLLFRSLNNVYHAIWYVLVTLSAVCIPLYQWKQAINLSLHTVHQTIWSDIYTVREVSIRFLYCTTYGPLVRSYQWSQSLLYHFIYTILKILPVLYSTVWRSTVVTLEIHCTKLYICLRENFKHKRSLLVHLPYERTSEIDSFGNHIL